MPLLFIIAGRNETHLGQQQPQNAPDDQTRPAYIGEPEETIPELPVNTPVPVKLTADSTQIFKYRATANEVISVYAYSVDPQNRADVVLEVLNPAMRRIAYHDDTRLRTPEGESIVLQDAGIENLILPEAGDYAIRVDSFNGVGEGQVEVILTEGNLFNESAREDGKRLIITATLPPGLNYRYALQAAEGATITFEARNPSGALDLLLFLIDETGEIRAQNDDHNSDDPSLGALDAQIADFVIPASGAYIIETRDFLGRSGAIELRIIREE